ncbi:MAG: hypothetical protein H6943_05070 [Zoogloeaceae bacterium]|nr:hypothetical protein [Zoogloeaceae bacterium]
MPKLLKPSKSSRQQKPLTFKITPELSERLAALSERAKAAGLTLDLNRELSIALARIVKAGEAELSNAKKANREASGS